LAWTSCIETEKGVWDPDSFQNAKMLLKYPGGSTGEVEIGKLLKGEPIAQYGDLRYYKFTGDSMVQPIKAPSAMEGLGHALQYFVSGKTYYTIDSSEVQAEMSANDKGWGYKTITAGLIAIPSPLVEKLYSRAAGRVRDESLLRDLMRHAEVLVADSPLIPLACKGRASAKLAFLAMAHNSEEEAKLYHSIVPGSLRLNSVAARAFAGGGTPWSWVWQLGLAGLVGIALPVSVRRSLVERFNKVVDGKMELGVFLRRLAFMILGFGKALMKRSMRALVGASQMTVANVVRVILGMFMTFKLAGWFRAPQGRLQTVGGATSMILGVVAEELFKRHFTAGTLAIVAAEGMVHGVKYLPTGIMHLVASQLPLPLGCAIHGMFNLGATFPGSLRRGSYLSWFSGSGEVPPDECVDSTGLRQNEPCVGKSTVRMPSGLNTVGQLPCLEEKVSWHFCALSVDGVEVTVFRSCLCNERAAVMSRVTSVDLKQNPVWATWWAQSKSIGVVTEPEFDKWLEHLPTRARGLVARAPCFGMSDRRDKRMKCFVKKEKRVMRVGPVTTKPNAAPRLIQGRSVDVKVATGPFTWAFGKRLATVYDTDGFYMYAGTRSAEEIGRFYDRIERMGMEGHWVAMDCKRWDRSVGPSPLKCLFDEYKRCGAPADCLKALEGRDRTRHGVTAGGIQFKRVGQVSSGDGDTSGGNSRIHLVMLQACTAIKAAVVHGDDSLIFTNDVDSVLSHYRLGGFDPVLAPDIDFCSSLLWPTTSGSVLGPKIGRVLGKTFYCIHKFEGDYKPWLRGVCLSLARSCSFVPILRKLIPILLARCGEGKVWRESSHEYKSRAISSHEVCESTWNFMYARYGLGESDTLAMERELESVHIGTSLTGPQWLQLVHRDTIG